MERLAEELEALRRELEALRRELADARRALDETRVELAYRHELAADEELLRSGDQLLALLEEELPRIRWGLGEVYGGAPIGFYPCPGGHSRTRFFRL